MSWMGWQGKTGDSCYPGRSMTTTVSRACSGPSSVATDRVTTSARETPRPVPAMSSTTSSGEYSKAGVLWTAVAVREVVAVVGHDDEMTPRSYCSGRVS